MVTGLVALLNPDLNESLMAQPQSVIVSLVPTTLFS